MQNLKGIIALILVCVYLTTTDRLAIFGDLRKMVTRHVFHRTARLTINYLRRESESFLKNIWASDRQT